MPEGLLSNMWYVFKSGGRLGSAYCVSLGQDFPALQWTTPSLRVVSGPWTTQDLAIDAYSALRAALEVLES